jgi:hypothetical protein
VVRGESRGFFSTKKKANEDASKIVFLEIEKLAEKDRESRMKTSSDQMNRQPQVNPGMEPSPQQQQPFDSRFQQHIQPPPPRGQMNQYDHFPPQTRAQPMQYQYPQIPPQEVKPAPQTHRQSLESLAGSLFLPVHYNYRQTGDTFSVQLVIAGMDLRGEGEGLGDVIEAVSEEGIKLVKERVVEKNKERKTRENEVKERYRLICFDDFRTGEFSSELIESGYKAAGRGDLIGQGADAMIDLEFDVFYQHVFGGVGAKKMETRGRIDEGGEKRKTESEGELDGKEVKKGKTEAGSVVEDQTTTIENPATNGEEVVGVLEPDFPVVTNGEHVSVEVEALVAPLALGGDQTAIETQASNIDLTSNSTVEPASRAIQESNADMQSAISKVDHQSFDFQSSNVDLPKPEIQASSPMTRIQQPISIDFSKLTPLPKKYSDIVSDRSQVVWVEHQDPSGGGVVCSCRVMVDRVFVGKRLCRDVDEAREDLAGDVIQALYPEALGKL